MTFIKIISCLLTLKKFGNYLYNYYNYYQVLLGKIIIPCGAKLDGGYEMVTSKNRAVTRIRHIGIKNVLWLKILKT